MLSPFELSKLSGDMLYKNIRLLETGHYGHTVAHAYSVSVMVSCADGSDWIARWHYATRPEAEQALNGWTGRGRPPGSWIRYEANEKNWKPLGVYGWPVKGA